MKRSSNLRKVMVEDLSPGELFRFSYGAGSVLALFLERVENGSDKVGIIQGAEFSSNMIWINYNGGPRDCLSYGRDWFLEEEHGAETYSGERESRGKASLYIDTPGLMMVFSPSSRSSFASRYVFDLQTAAHADLGSAAAPVLSWKIWESEDHRDSGSTALFEAS